MRSKYQLFFLQAESYKIFFIGLAYIQRCVDVAKHPFQKRSPGPFLPERFTIKKIGISPEQNLCTVLEVPHQVKMTAVIPPVHQQGMRVKSFDLFLCVGIPDATKMMKSGFFCCVL